MADVRWLPAAREEFNALPAEERAAIQRAVLKLEAMGDGLAYPHQSAVIDAENLRELRPRAGRSRWRAFYRRVEPDVFVIAAVGSEAQANRRNFRRAVHAASERLSGLSGDDP